MPRSVKKSPMVQKNRSTTRIAAGFLGRGVFSEMDSMGLRSKNAIKKAVTNGENMGNTYLTARNAPDRKIEKYRKLMINARLFSMFKNDPSVSCEKAGPAALWGQVS